jgi:hypothetical protein
MCGCNSGNCSSCVPQTCTVFFFQSWPVAGCQNAVRCQNAVNGRQWEAMEGRRRASLALFSPHNADSGGAGSGVH